MAVVSIPRDELQAAIEARRELGPERQDEVVAAFLDRVERDIDRRVEARLARNVSAPARDPRTLLTIVSLAISVPLLGIGGGIAGLAGLIVVCLALVAVNAAVWLGTGGTRR